MLPDAAPDRAALLEAAKGGDWDYCLPWPRAASPKPASTSTSATAAPEAMAGQTRHVPDHSLPFLSLGVRTRTGVLASGTVPSRTGGQTRKCHFSKIKDMKWIRSVSFINTLTSEMVFKARRNSHLQAVRKKKLMTKSELLFTQHCLEHVGL